MVGSSVRKPLDENEKKNPGVGTYGLKNMGVGGTSASFKGTEKIDHWLREQRGVPGSGTYNPSIELVRRRPKTSM